MGSSYSPWIYRKLLYHIPGLFRRCPEGNYHWRWDRLCYCMQGANVSLEGKQFHGGIYDLKRGVEYQHCSHCHPLSK
jgi:hypothetical protein